MALGGGGSRRRKASRQSKLYGGKTLRKLRQDSSMGMDRLASNFRKAIAKARSFAARGSCFDARESLAEADFIAGAWDGAAIEAGVKHRDVSRVRRRQIKRIKEKLRYCKT